MIKYFNLEQKNKLANIKAPDVSKEDLEFLIELGLEIEVRYVGLSPQVFDTNTMADKYSITLRKGGRETTFDFYNSVYHSGEFMWLNGGKCKYPTRVLAQGMIGEIDEDMRADKRSVKILRDRIAPDIESVMSCVEVFNGTFEDFCMCFGYDTDSRKAFVTYERVLERSKEFRILFSDGEINEIMEKY